MPTCRQTVDGIECGTVTIQDDGFISRNQTAVAGAMFLGLVWYSDVL